MWWEEQDRDKGSRPTPCLQPHGVPSLKHPSPPCLQFAASASRGGEGGALPSLDCSKPEHLGHSRCVVMVRQE